MPIKSTDCKSALAEDTYIRSNPQVPNGMKIPMTMANKMIITNY